MSNAYISTAADSLGTSLVQTALDRYVRFQLRSMPLFRAFADTRVEQQTAPGSSVVFQFYNDLAAQTAELDEFTDPDAVGLPSTTSVTVTMREYGNVVLKTRKLQLTAITDIDSGVADILSYNMRDSIDALVSPVLIGGTNVIRRNGATLKSNLISGGAGTVGAVAATDILTSPMVRLGVAKLRSGKVIPRDGELYATVLHSDCAHDLKAETGAAAWRDPHNLSGAHAIWTSNIGIYEGAYYVESPRIPYAADGASSARVYRNLMMGREALAEAVVEEPGIVIGEVTDKLKRFRPLGWKAFLGWSRFREAALIRVEAASSIA